MSKGLFITLEGPEGSGKSSAIKISYYGNRKIEKIDIDEDALDDKEMLEDMLKIAINEVNDKVYEAEQAIQNKFTKGMKMPF